MSIFKRGEAALRRWRKQYLADTGSYRSALGLLPAIPMTRASTTTETDNGELIVESKCIDWLIDANDLVWAGVKRQPEPGDRIDIDGEKYEVCSLGGEKCFTPHGNDGLTYRIHTKQINSSLGV